MKIGKEEFGRLYKECYKEVYYVAFKITGDEQNAADITQDAFMKAYSKISELKEESSFAAFVKSIAHNEAVNFLKRKHIIEFEPAEDENFENVADESKSPEDEVVDQDVQDILMKLINKLPAEQRITLFLFYYENMSVKEIAKTCGCSEKTIYSRLTYAKRNLKAEVEKSEDNGVKLRCVAALPFLYIIFKMEAKNVFASTMIPDCTITNVASTGGKMKIYQSLPRH